MGKKKQRFTSGNKGLEKVVKSMAEHMRANSTSPSDSVRPDSQSNLASQPISDDDDDLFGIPTGTTLTSLSDRIRPELKKHLPSQPISDDGDDLFGIPTGTTPTSLSNRIRPELKKHLPSQSISDDGDDLFGIPTGTTPTSLSNRVRPDFIESQGDIQKSNSSSTAVDWEEVLLHIPFDERRSTDENTSPGCSSEATVGLVKSSQSNEEACPDLFMEKGTQADLLQENPINSPKSMSSTLLPNNVVTDNRTLACDVSPPTSPIIRMEKGSNTPLRIALY